MQRVLVFGVNGFVGGYVAKEFAQHGYEVCGTDQQEQSRVASLKSYSSANLHDADSMDALLAHVVPDVIINLAAISSVGQSWSMPAETFHVNVVGTINVLEGVRKHCPHAKVLLIGSSEEYAPSTEVLTEDSPVLANNPYGASKAAQENIARMFAQQYGLRIYRTRSFNHIGPGQNPAFVIPSWCKQVAEIQSKGKPGILKVGNISVSRDFCDVRDVVRAYRLLVESNYTNEVFNIGSGISYPLKTILQTIIGFSSQQIEVQVDSSLLRKTDNPYICADCSKAERLLGWHARCDIQESLRAVFDSFVLDSVVE